MWHVAVCLTSQRKGRCVQYCLQPRPAPFTSNVFVSERSYFEKRITKKKITDSAGKVPTVEITSFIDFILYC